MEILNLSLPATNRFASNYLEQSAEILPFFHYQYNDRTEDERRLRELASRTFPRTEIAAHIESFMNQFSTSDAVRHSIDKLKKENSVVVIGGQQAGILTGPLYSIHKVISIIKLAEQKEKQLGVPVVPVFWIAGEDHDYHEVNHVYISVNEKADKCVYPKKLKQKKMVSDIELNRETCLEWVKNVIENFGETEHTNELVNVAENLIDQSTTFVDFFAQIIMELFKDYGLLIVDSGNREFRKLQKEFFKTQIQNHKAITYSLLEQQSLIRKDDYPLTIDGNERAANLFYYDEKRNDRILLEFDHESNLFVGKSGSLSFSLEQLLEIADDSPERLSNNVVTRPLMQEWLFPTIAFIAGPGEISYWAELKLVFEYFKINLPPIVPRLNITFLDKSIESTIDELHLNLEEVLKRGVETEKQYFLETIKDKELDELFSSIKDSIMEQYQLIEKKTIEIDKGLLSLVQKNESYIQKEINFMQLKLEDAVKFRHEVVLNKFNRVELSLRPSGAPQERLWNIFYYLNQYGLNFIDKIMDLDFHFDGRHKVLKI